MAKSKAETDQEDKDDRDAGNRSDAVRDALAENPRAGSKEIVTKLAERGVKVSPTLVYYVKSRQNKERRRAKRARVASQSQDTSVGNPIELVLRVKQIAREVGGVKNLKTLVDLLAE